MSREGMRFGPYELRGLLGRGGMGEVYTAYDTSKDRVVALKLLPPHLADDPGYKDRFRHESRTAARLAEPHVIPIHDFGEHDGVLFMDMRLVEGADLRAILDSSGALSAERAVALIGQIAEALDAAHASGLVHRDVKPENVLVTKNDFAYLVDFGIARQDQDTRVTRPGSAIGSLDYMAPERFSDLSAPGPAADIYALGAVLAECLTGRKPFPDADDLPALLAAHAHGPRPKPSRMNPRVPAALDDVVARAMDATPARRYQRAGDLASAAQAAVGRNQLPDSEAATNLTPVAPKSPVAATGTTTQPRGVQTSPARRRVRWRWAIPAAVTALVVGGALAIATQRHEGSSDAAPTSATSAATPTVTRSPTSSATATSGPTSTTTRPSASPTVTLPDGALSCASGANGSRYYVKEESRDKSGWCKFGASVESAFANTGGSVPLAKPLTISAYSPAKDEFEPVACAPQGALVTCRTTNSAVFITAGDAQVTYGKK